MRIDEALAAGARMIGRRVGKVPLYYQIVDRLRRHFAKRYLELDERWKTISDFDGDLKIRLDRSSQLGSKLYWMGINSLNEILVCKRHLKPDSVFVDIGANQGEFSLFAAKRVTQGKVIALEPRTQMFAQLKENLELNRLRNIELLNCGCSDTSRMAELYGSSRPELNQARNEGLASLYSGERRDTPLETITLRTFDEIADELKFARVDMMKIDVEGAELPVLRGAARTLRAHKPHLLLEISEDNFTAAGYRKEDLFDFLSEFDYKIFAIRYYGRLVPIENLRDLKFGNVLCK